MYNVHQNSHESFLFIRDNDCGQEPKKNVKDNDITKARARLSRSFQPVGQGSQISTGSHPSHLFHSTI